MVTLNAVTGDAALERRNKDVALNAEQKNKDLNVEMKMWLRTPNEKCGSSDVKMKMRL